MCSAIQKRSNGCFHSFDSGAKTSPRTTLQANNNHQTFHALPHMHVSSVPTKRNSPLAMNFFFTGRRGRSSKTLPAQALSRPTVPRTNSLPNAESIPASPPREYPNLTRCPTQNTTDRTDNTQSPSVTSAVEPPPTTQSTPLAILSPGGIPFWNPPTPSSSSPIGAVDLVHNFLRAHHNAPAANSYLSMIRKFYSVSEDEYQFMMHEFFPGNNTHVRYATSPSTAAKITYSD